MFMSVSAAGDRANTDPASGMPTAAGPAALWQMVPCDNNLGLRAMIPVPGGGRRRALVESCRALKPDLVITDIKMPDMDGIDAAARIARDGPVPVILVSAYHDPEFIRRAEADHILAYLVKPIKQADLEPAIALAVRRFEQFQELRKEAADLRQALALTREIGAKGLEMRTALSFARLLSNQDRRQEARSWLAEIYTWFTEGFDTADLKDAKALLEELGGRAG